MITKQCLEYGRHAIKRFEWIMLALLLVLAMSAFIIACDDDDDDIADDDLIDDDALDDDVVDDDMVDDDVVDDDAIDDDAIDDDAVDDDVVDDDAVDDDDVVDDDVVDDDAIDDDVVDDDTADDDAIQVEIESIEETFGFRSKTETQVSLAIGASDTLHLIFAEAQWGSECAYQNLYYGAKEGASWNIEMIAEGDCWNTYPGGFSYGFTTYGEFDHLLIDEQNELHLLYSHQNVEYYENIYPSPAQYTNIGTLYYLPPEKTLTQLDRDICIGEEYCYAIYTGRFCTFALDSTGGLHAVYQKVTEDMTSENSYIAYLADPTAKTEPVIIDDCFRDYMYLWLGIDSADHVHLLYRNETDLNYATNESGDWEVNTIGTVEYFTSIDAVIDDDVIHAVYDMSHNLCYLTNVSGTWHDEAVVTTPKYPHSPSLALDDQGNVHAAFYDYVVGQGDLWYAWQNGAEWSAMMIDEEMGRAFNTDIVIDSAGRVHIAYNSNYRTRHATLTRNSLPR